jgi:hypothetical protein
MGVDLTEPRAAAQMLGQLLTQAGHKPVIMLQVSAESMALSVLDGGRPRTFGYRDSQIAEVASDMAYVDQAVFDPAEFHLADVGALFRAATGVSGSKEHQSLQIVDYSAGQVMMSVSTNPESKTVFFNPDGSLLEVLDLSTQGGIARGLSDVCGSLTSVYSVEVVSGQMVLVDYPGVDRGKVARRQRTARVPVITITRTETPAERTFDPRRIRPEVVWKVVDRRLGVGDVPADAAWRVRATLTKAAPELEFTIAGKQFKTDLYGNELP